MARGWSIAIAAFSLWAASASGLDVTGNWSVSGASFSTLTTVSLMQSGTDLSVCLNGWGTIATGTVDEGTGAFTLDFDLYFASQVYEFGVCYLQWNGTFALDGNSIIGSEDYSLNCGLPFPAPPCCLPGESDPITATRTSPTVVCCGNGVVEGEGAVPLQDADAEFVDLTGEVQIEVEREGACPLVDGAGRHRTPAVEADAEVGAALHQAHRRERRERRARQRPIAGDVQSGSGGRPETERRARDAPAP